MSHHAATVDKGLRMKIKRTNKMGPANNKIEGKHEVVKSGDKATSDNTVSANGTPDSKQKQTTEKDSKEKSPKVKPSQRKDRVVTKEKEKGSKTDPGLNSVCTSLEASFSQVAGGNSQTETSQPKKEGAPPDPYEFNAKVEDDIGLPVKKVKTEKMDVATSPTHQPSHAIIRDTNNVGVITDPECLGPCEPGTHVNLEGIVWTESENGMLVVNVTWRNKTYVGTLLDATKHVWAPPRLNCESPVSEFECRTPKGRAKRSRGSTNTPVNDKGLEGRKLRKNRKSSTFQAPPSPAKSDTSNSGGVKRKGRPTDIDLNSSGNKRSKPSAPTPTLGLESPSSVLIECPEPNCNKKYKHQNGLKYHQTHAHRSSMSGTPGPEDAEEENTRDTCYNNDDDEEVESNAAEQMDTVGENSNSSLTSKSNKNNSNVSSTDKASSNASAKDSVKAENGPSKIEIEAMEAESQDTPIPKESIPKDSTSGGKKDSSSSTAVKTVPVTKAVTKAVASIPSGNAFQIVSGQSTNFTSMGISNQPIVPKVSGQALALTGTVTSNPIPTAIPVQVTGTVIPQTEVKVDHAKTEKSIRPKITCSQPILPTIAALTTTVAATQVISATSAPSSQVTQLKPIQPKPTVSGETPPVNPFLGFKDLKDKKSKQKGKKDSKPFTKEGLVPIQPTSILPPNNQSKTGIVEPVKNEQQMGVIKVAPMVNKQNLAEKRKDTAGSGVVNIQRHDRSDKPLSLPLGGSNVGVVTAQVQPSPKGVDLTTYRNADVSPALKVNCVDTAKSGMIENAQSPSYYSDISEESGSPAQQPPSESPDKKEEGVKNKDGAMIPGTIMENAPPYNMYGAYYGQNYGMPQPNMHSPNTQQNAPPSNLHQMKQAGGQNGNKDSRSPAENLKPVTSEPKVKMESKDVKEEKIPMDGRPSPSLSQQEYYQMHNQNWVKQRMLQLQVPPHAQYQFLATYGQYNIDSTYRMHRMANDPAYRSQYERLSEEERRRMESGLPLTMDRKSDSPKMHHSNSAQDLSLGSMENKSKSDSSKDSDSKREENSIEKDKRGGGKGDDVDTNDLSEHGEKNRFDQRQDPYGMPRDKMAANGGPDEQIRREQMYQQQIMIRQQKREEQKKGVSSRREGRLPENSAKNSQSSAGDKNKDVENDLSKIRTDIKREPVDVKPSRDNLDNSDSRLMEEKRKMNASPFLDRNRNTDMSKNKQHSPMLNKVSSPMSLASSMATSVPMSVSSGAPYYNVYHGQFMPGAPPPPQFASGGMYHNMNPAMMYPGPNYLPQYPYHMGNEMEDEKQAPPKMMHGDTESKETNNLKSSGTSSSHKIHELQDKSGRPLSSPHRASPLPAKSSTPVDKSQEYTNSPPIQRHMHTHLHTHVMDTPYPVSVGVYPFPGLFPGASQQKTPPSATVMPQPGAPNYQPPK